MIGGQAPSAYLNQLQTHRAVQLDDPGMDAILLTHCIDPATLRRDDFEGFVNARKRSLLTRIEAVMGKAIVLSDEAVPEDEALPGAMRKRWL
ncbi:hypothetical protein [Leptodesmis sichuanensis]|uniref:hypothetical protein n=1 Tax=Leptodesmis sichuanensis TaxID=2906798 RepID=UPI001F2426FB|nr:hypothetical protein [Leptodesmis sichuanensis]UIE38528.1 hypothetical protein KIK02_02445 [Leptodesmis sichuanensis A121]UIE39294.1 hypothetical protein KIK02_06875 [Leptodesmis sichuanensis A121]